MKISHTQKKKSQCSRLQVNLAGLGLNVEQNLLLQFSLRFNSRVFRNICPIGELVQIEHGNPPRVNANVDGDDSKEVQDESSLGLQIQTMPFMNCISDCADAPNVASRRYNAHIVLILLF